MPIVGLCMSYGYPCSATRSGSSRMCSSMSSGLAAFYSLPGFGSFRVWLGAWPWLTCRCFGLASCSVVMMYRKCSCSVCSSLRSSCGCSLAGWASFCRAFSYRAFASWLGVSGFWKSQSMTLGSSHMYPQPSRHQILSFSEASASAPQFGQFTIYYA